MKATALGCNSTSMRIASFSDSISASWEIIYTSFSLHDDTIMRTPRDAVKEFLNS